MDNYPDGMTAKDYDYVEGVGRYAEDDDGITRNGEVVYNHYWRAPVGTPMAAWLLEHQHDLERAIEKEEEDKLFHVNQGLEA